MKDRRVLATVVAKKQLHDSSRPRPSGAAHSAHLPQPARPPKISEKGVALRPEPVLHRHQPGSAKHQATMFMVCGATSKPGLGSVTAAQHVDHGSGNKRAGVTASPEARGKRRDFSLGSHYPTAPPERIGRFKKKPGRHRSRRKQRRRQKSRRRNEPIAGKRVRHRRACSDTYAETATDEHLVLERNLRSKRDSEHHARSNTVVTLSMSSMLS